jgi:hypothetical protein
MILMSLMAALARHAFLQGMVRISYITADVIRDMRVVPLATVPYRQKSTCMNRI